MLLNNSEFNKQLKDLFQQTKDKGSVFYTLKRASHPSLKRKLGEVKDKHYCLVRVTVDKKTISTYLNSNSVDKFLNTYNALLRNEMSALKKKVRNKKEKEGKDKDTKEVKDKN
ncbi:hypothetical protein K502DRAFT_362649 [Neoconidiobolus thromboides FSU 785]|nr:hypothetical protein K502DRAFT_362649 [Neoconidiobolus thromboides FSU 785]